MVKQLEFTDEQNIFSVMLLRGEERSDQNSIRVLGGKYCNRWDGDDVLRYLKEGLTRNEPQSSILVLEFKQQF